MFNHKKLLKVKQIYLYSIIQTRCSLAEQVDSHIVVAFSGEQVFEKPLLTEMLTKMGIQRLANGTKLKQKTPHT